MVSSPQHSTDASELLELADAAMYSAKAAGTSVEVGAEPASNGNGNGNSE